MSMLHRERRAEVDPLHRVDAWLMHGIECHVCGRPGEYWCSGVTLPCGCGARDSAHLKAAQECHRKHGQIAKARGRAAALTRHWQPLARRARA